MRIQLAPSFALTAAALALAACGTESPSSSLASGATSSGGIRSTSEKVTCWPVQIADYGFTVDGIVTDRGLADASAALQLGKISIRGVDPIDESFTMDVQSSVQSSDPLVVFKHSDFSLVINHAAITGRGGSEPTAYTGHLHIATDRFNWGPSDTDVGCSLVETPPAH